MKYQLPTKEYFKREKKRNIREIIIWFIPSISFLSGYYSIKINDYQLLYLSIFASIAALINMIVIYISACQERIEYLLINYDDIKEKTTKRNMLILQAELLIRKINKEK